MIHPGLQFAILLSVFFSVSLFHLLVFFCPYADPILYDISFSLSYLPISIRTLTSSRVECNRNSIQAVFCDEMRISSHYLMNHHQSAFFFRCFCVLYVVYTHTFRRYCYLATGHLRQLCQHMVKRFRF